MSPQSIQLKNNSKIKETKKNYYIAKKKKNNTNIHTYTHKKLQTNLHFLRAKSREVRARKTKSEA